MAKLLIPLLSLALLTPAFAEEETAAAAPASICTWSDEPYSFHSRIAFAAVIRRHLPEIRDEYVAALEREPSLRSGKITVRFTIAPDGSVGNAGVIEDTVGCPPFSASIVERVGTWRFPPISQGDRTVVYPFVFLGPEAPVGNAEPAGEGAGRDRNREEAEPSRERYPVAGEYGCEPPVIVSRLEKTAAFVISRRKPSWVFNEDELNGFDGETRAFLVDAAAFLAEAAPDPAALLLPERADSYAALGEVEAEGCLLSLADERLALGTADTVEMLPAAGGGETKAARNHREAREKLEARRDKCRREIDGVNERIEKVREERPATRELRRDELINEGGELMDAGIEGDGRCWVLLALAELYFERSTAAHVVAVREYREKLTAARAKGEILKEEGPEPDYGRAIAASQQVAYEYKDLTCADRAYYTLAYCLFAQFEYEEAAKTFYMLTQLYPDSEYATEAYFRIGEYFFDQYEFDKAVKYYSRVPPTDPAFGAAATYKRAWSFYDMGDLDDEGRAEYVTAINEFSSYLDRYGPSAPLYREARDFAAYALYEWAYPLTESPADGAVALFEEQFRGDRERDYSPAVLHVLADVYAAKEEWKEAAVAYEALLRAYPEYEETPRALASLAACYGKDEENRDAAYKARVRLVEDYGPGSRWYHGLTDPYLRHRALQRWEDELYEVAVYGNVQAEHMCRVNPEEAKRLYREAIRRYEQYLAAFPANPKAYHVNFYLGEAYYAVGDFAAAAAAYEVAALHYTDRERYEIDKWDKKFTQEQSLFNAVVARAEIYDGYVMEAAETEVEESPREGIGRPLTADEAELARLCNLFVDRYPQSPDAPSVLSELAGVYYYADDYESAREAYGMVVEDYAAAPDADSRKEYDQLYVNALECIAKSYFNEAEFCEEGAAYEDARRRYELASEWYDRTAREAEGRKVSETVERAGKLAALVSLKAAEMRGAGAGLEEAGEARPVVTRYDFVEIYPPLRPIVPSAVKAKRAEAEGYEAVAATYGPHNPDSERIAFEKAAETYYEARDWDKASRAYLDLIKYYESGDKFYVGTRQYKEAYEKAAEGFERRRDWGDAASVYLRVAGHAEFKGTGLARDCLFRAGMMYEQLEDWPRAAEIFDRFTKEYPEEARPRLEAAYRLARAEEKLGRRDDALEHYKFAVAIYGISIDRGYDVAGEERFAAESRFIVTDAEFDEYEAIEFVMPQDVFEDNILKKIKQCQNLRSGYVEVVDLGIPEWSVAAHCRLGDMYYEFAEALRGAEIPKELKPEYWEGLPDGDERKPLLGKAYYEFTSQLEEQAGPLNEKAAVEYREAVKIAETAGIDNEWSRKARERLAGIGSGE